MISPTHLAAARLARTVYGAHLERLLADHHLMPAGDLRLPISATESGLVVGATADLLPVADSAVVVVAPQLGYARGQLARIRLDWLAHLAMGLTTAGELGLRCIVYLPIDEQLPHATPPIQRAWRRLGEQLDHLVGHVTKDLTGPPEVTVLRSTDDQVRTELDRAVGAHRGWLTDSAVAGLNRIRAAHLPTTGVTSHRLAANRYAVMRHVPSTLTAIAGGRVDQVIAIDTLSAAPTINLARRIAAVQGGRVGLLAHLPAPNLTGTSAMSTAADTAALILGEDPAITRTKLRQLAGYQRTVWHGLWQHHHQALAEPIDAGLTAMTSYYRRLHDEAVSR